MNPGTRVWRYALEMALASIAISCGGGGGGGSSTSNPGSSPVTTSITSQPAPRLVPSGGLAILTVQATGNPSPSYVWQRSDGAGGTWRAIPGATSASYTFQAGYRADDGAEFRVLVENVAGAVTSSTAVLDVEPVIYAARSFALLGYWRDQAWVDLVPPPGAASWTINSLLVTGPDVYVAGDCDLKPGYWKNGAWVSLPLAPGSSSGSVSAILVSGADVYAGGSSESVPGYWRNQVWVELALPPAATDGRVRALCLEGTNLFAGGGVQLPQGYRAGYWLNGGWVGLPVNSIKGSGEVTALVMSAQHVYAGGFNNDGSGVQAPGYWLDGSWTSLPTRSGSPYGMVNAMAVVDQHVYAAAFDGTYASCWMDGAEAYFGTGSGDITSMVVCRSDLFAAGCQFGPSGQIPGYWWNGRWTGLSSPASPGYEIVKTIFVQ